MDNQTPLSDQPGLISISKPLNQNFGTGNEAMRWSTGPHSHPKPLNQNFGTGNQAMTNLDRVCCTENNNNLYTSPPNQTARFSPQPLPAYYSPHLCSQRCRREVGETNRTTPLSPSLPLPSFPPMLSSFSLAHFPPSLLLTSPSRQRSADDCSEKAR